MRAAAALCLALMAAGCAPNYPVVAPKAPVEPRAVPAPTAPAPAAPQPSPPDARPRTEALPLRSPIPEAQAANRDQCGAAQLQGFVGRLRTEIPVPLDPRRQRVACTTCPAADNVDPGRLNFLFDAQTGRIRQVRCG